MSNSGRGDEVTWTGAVASAVAIIENTNQVIGVKVYGIGTWSCNVSSKPPADRPWARAQKILAGYCAERCFKQRVDDVGGGKDLLGICRSNDVDLLTLAHRSLPQLDKRWEIRLSS